MLIEAAMATESPPPQFRDEPTHGRKKRRQHHVRGAAEGGEKSGDEGADGGHGRGRPKAGQHACEDVQTTATLEQRHQGTTSSRALLFHERAKLLGVVREEHPQGYSTRQALGLRPLRLWPLVRWREQEPAVQRQTGDQSRVVPRGVSYRFSIGRIIARGEANGNCLHRNRHLDR